MNKTIYILGLLIFISSCKAKVDDESIFPKVKNINDLAKTDFVPTLESNFDIDTNIIYGATIPIAWNEIKKEIATPLKNFSSKELERLNHSKSFINVLKEDEYETSVEVNGNEIIAKAYFRKSLPFEEPLTKFEQKLTFNKSKVESFGFWGSSSNVKINYFNDENDFSISLFPKNNDHEIILIMNQKEESKNSNFTEYLKLYEKEKKQQKVYFNDDDKVEIPIVEFNLEKIFNQFTGSKFQSNLKEFEVTEFYQKNALVFNENGAEVESYAVEAVEAVEELERIKPKMMIFNKPFVILLKRKDAENPYFGVYIANDELLKKE